MIHNFTNKDIFIVIDEAEVDGKKHLNILGGNIFYKVPQIKQQLFSILTIVPENYQLKGRILCCYFQILHHI